MNSQTSFEEVIKACKKGKRSAQKELYRRYFAYGMTVSVHYTNRREEGEEVLNDAFCKVFKNIAKFNTDYPFKGWFRRIVVNSAIDYHRKYHNLEIQDNIIPITEATMTYNMAERELSQDDVLKIVQHLSPAYRIVFILYVVEGLKHKEIAEKLGISIGTSKSNYAKARAKLQKIIVPYYPNQAMTTQRKENGQ